VGRDNISDFTTNLLEQRLVTIKADQDAMLSLQEAVERVRLNLSGFGFHEKRLALQALEIRVVRVGKKQLEISGRIPVEKCPDASSPTLNLDERCHESPSAGGRCAGQG
jgi:hypothetical protein